MIITEIKEIKNHEKAVELLRSGKVKFENTMILWQNTGFAWLNPIVTNGSYGQDLLDTLDEVYFSYENKNLPFKLYDYKEVIKDEFIDENYLPINGGEYYTDMLSHVEQF